MNKDNQKNQLKDLRLDKEELSVEEALLIGEYLSVKNQDNSKKIFEEAAKAYRELQKTKRITLRVNNEDLLRVKAKAKKSGLPYQRLISVLIHQYAKGEARVTI